jgi:hypothetical protein
MKLDRAKQRMKELEEALQSFYATNPFKFSGKADLQAGKVVYTMDSVKDAPDEASPNCWRNHPEPAKCSGPLNLPAFSKCRRNRNREEYLLSHWWKQNIVREQEKQPDYGMTQTGHWFPCSHGSYFVS